jgi:PadR family transcriptional regulator, regulatory protein PadR
MREGLGTFEQAVLVAIVRLGDEAYGRAILKEVESRLQRQVAAGAIYTTLERLEEKELVTSELGPGTPQRGGRPRRFYIVAPSGLHALDESHTTAQNIWRGIPRLLRRRA